MTDGRAWLQKRCADLLADASAAAGDGLRTRAAALGAEAARREVSVPDLVEAVLHAAGAAWDRGPTASTVAAEHDRAGKALRMTQLVASAAVRGHHRDARAELDRRELDRTAFLDDLLTGHGDPGRLAARAQRYGIRLSGRHTVAVARGQHLTGAVVRAVDDALAARFGAGNTLTSLRDGHLVCVAAGELRGVPAELAHHLLRQLGPEGWQIGVGRPHPGLTGLATSLDEARNTLDLADRLGFTATVLHAADLLVFPVLLRDRDAITDLVTSVLGPLEGARGGARPLLDTLMALFDNQGNQTAAARQLHVSVRAVAYRLDRVHALTGYHAGEPTQRFTLHTAVLGARLLGWPSKRPNGVGHTDPRS